MSMSGALTEHPVPTVGAFPVDVTVGSDGNVWFSEGDSSKIGRVNLVPAIPTIQSFAPTSGPVGTTVTINGTNFTGTNSVTFNGVTARFTVNSDAKITAAVPIGATTGPIVVTAAGGMATSATNFVVQTGGPTVHDRSVTLRLRKHLVAKGRVNSDLNACVSDVNVKIQRRGGGKWRTIATTSTTGADGRYRQNIADKAGRYRALVPKSSPDGDDQCRKDISLVVRHNH
jgi:IPT/TIG domain